MAAQLLAGCERLDPAGEATAQGLFDMCQRGECFAIDSAQGSAVYVVRVRNKTAWVDAIKGRGDMDITAAVDAVLSGQAQGLRSMGFQTARRGLVRKAQARGWRVTGWIMQKEIIE